MIGVERTDDKWEMVLENTWEPLEAFIKKYQDRFDFDDYWDILQKQNLSDSMKRWVKSKRGNLIIEMGRNKN